MITTADISSLVAEAWPLSLTPVNIMSGFKKTGIFPLNPGASTDRELAPSKIASSELSDVISESTGACGSLLVEVSESSLSKGSDVSSVNSLQTCAGSSSSYLEDVLSLPKAKPKKQSKREGLTTHSQLISGSPFLSTLQQKKEDKEKEKQEKAEKRAIMKAKKEARDKEKEAKKKATIEKKQRGRKKTAEKNLDSESEDSEVEDTVACVECGDTS